MVEEEWKRYETKDTKVGANTIGTGRG